MAATSSSKDSCALIPLPGMKDPLVFLPPLKVWRAGLLAALLGPGTAAVRIPPRASPTVLRASLRFNPSSVVLENDVSSEAGAKALADEAIKAITETLVIRTILVSIERWLGLRDTVRGRRAGQRLVVLSAVSADSYSVLLQLLLVASSDKRQRTKKACKNSPFTAA